MNARTCRIRSCNLGHEQASHHLFLLTAACELYTLFYAVWGSRAETA